MTFDTLVADAMRHLADDDKDIVKRLGKLRDRMVGIDPKLAGLTVPQTAAAMILSQLEELEKGPLRAVEGCLEIRANQEG